MRAAVTEILITGGGPAGLMMACQLVKQRIRFRIIDKNIAITDHSGALIVHAVTLEILNQLGVADKLIKEGRILKAINFSFNGHPGTRVDISHFGRGVSEFPYALLVEQSKTEALLNRFLEQHGRFVERGSELKDFTEYTDHIESEIVDSQGKDETVFSDYLVAADGGHSFVRSKLEIPMSGTTHARSLFATDCESDLNLPDNEALIAFSGTSTTGFFPLAGNLWRIDGALRWHMNGREIEFGDIDGGFAGITRVKANIYNPRWFSTFHSHRRNAAFFNTDRCFLIGDAAHLYSPVGAQGMNHGIHDAFNLAWKISLVIRKLAKPCLLETYEYERKAVAKSTAGISDLLFDFLSTDRPFYKFFRISVLPVILKLTKPVFKKHSVKKFLFRKISGVGISYRDSTLTFKPEKLWMKGPSAGERLPAVIYSQDGITANITDHINGTTFQLLIFNMGSCPDFELLLSKFTRHISVSVLTYQPGTIELFKKFGIKKTTYYVVRPDYYISCKGYSCGYLEKYLNNILIPVT